MKKLSLISLLLILASGTVPFTGHSAEIKTRFGTITYDSPDALREFNHELYMGRLKSRINESDTLEGEIKHKLEYIVRKVMLVLDMQIPKLDFQIVIHPSEDGVQADFNRLYGVEVNYIAFYSPSRNIVFYSAEDASIRVVAHEIGHVIAEHYFQVSPPSKIHEVMAQYAEKHVTD